jgi:muconolactone delta-isomerase
MRYMAALTTVRPPDPALQAAELAKFQELLAAGKLQTAYLAATRQRGWLVVQGDSAAEARQIVGSLPFAQFWEIEIIPLLSDQN